MIIVAGQAFNAFAQFPSSSSPSAAAKATLLHQVDIACLELIALGVGSAALGSLTPCLWIWVGEINAMSVGTAVYQAVVGEDIVWFDLNLGDQMVDENPQGPVRVGGLMAKFARNNTHMPYSRLHALMVSNPHHPIRRLRPHDRSSLLSSFRQPTFISRTAISATIIERAISAISTLKAFNATLYENSRATQPFINLQQAARKLNVLQALVREHKVGAGDVMSVFWACLIATSNLQMCIPQFIVLAKGKFSIAALLGVVGDWQPSSPSAHSPSTFTSSTPRSSIFFFRCNSHHLRKITFQSANLPCTISHSLNRGSPRSQEPLAQYPSLFYTGDGAARDVHWYICIKGRAHDVINVSGHRLSTAEIESALIMHKGVAEIAAIGTADELTGQAVFAPVSQTVSTLDPCLQQYQLKTRVLMVDYRDGEAREPRKSSIHKYDSGGRR
ncbi:hypothetical protein BYT27DRAFT_7261468 [Phlegmacium glaucopus]|nr:hypothetical protein BYT27DRAFT_7261468 [Phlegmacium glaucopus]